MRKLIACCLAASLPLAALANGFDVPNVNPRDLAMVAAAVASQNDAGATYACPAALARLDGLSLSLGGTLLDIRTDWNAPAGPINGSSSSGTTFHPAFPVSLFASYSGKLADHGIGAGVGMTIPGGGNVFWPNDWAGRSRIIQVDRRVYGFYATGGLELVKQVRVGGGFVYYRTTEDLVQGVDPTNGTVELSAAGGHASFDVALEVTPFEGIPLNFAVDYKHQVYQTLTGTAHFNVPATLQPQLQDQNVTHVLPYPNVLNAAVAYQIIPPLTLNFTYTFNRYVIYSEDLFVGDKPLPGPILVPRNYGNGHVFRFGAEWFAMPRLALRAGVLRDITGMPKQTGPNGELLSSTYSPTLPDSNTWAFGIGAGWSFARNFSLNGGAFLAFMDQVTSTGPLAFPGRYQTHVFIYGLGISYNWLPGERIGTFRPM